MIEYAKLIKDKAGNTLKATYNDEIYTVGFMDVDKDTVQLAVVENGICYATYVKKINEVEWVI